jgi:hypothetical protein
VDCLEGETMKWGNIMQETAANLLETAYNAGLAMGNAEADEIDARLNEVIGSVKPTPLPRDELWQTFIAVTAAYGLAIGVADSGEADVRVGANRCDCHPDTCGCDDWPADSILRESHVSDLRLPEDFKLPAIQSSGDIFKWGNEMGSGEK